MKHKTIYFEDLSAQASISHFEVENGVEEFHAMISLNDVWANAETQFQNIETAIERLQQFDYLKTAQLVLKRYFVSDAINQAKFLPKNDLPEAVSVVQQLPLNGTKVTVWLYFVSEGALSKNSNGTTEFQHSIYKHLFNTQLHERNGSVANQTTEIFNRYVKTLSDSNCTLQDHCIRTWIYVQDVDVHYKGMVDARVECFDKEGLTTTTHYIASTGIEGRYIYPEVLMLMDAYSVSGLKQEQIRFIEALTHLNPTHEYGVTFERGTSVDYGDRRHIFISGTASIDNKGKVVHSQNIELQTLRTSENIEALLKNADAAMSDIAQMIVYLRDTADYHIVNKYLEQHYGDTPKVIVLAPVCRPGWLIEIECIAIKELKNSDFERF